jgi:hypothetical protein
MRKVIRVLLFPFEMLAVGLIWFYKIAISPWLKPNCSLYPTCSTYMLICIKKHGLFKGMGLGINRIIRCAKPHPHSESYDAPPENIKGDFKWLI